MRRAAETQSSEPRTDQWRRSPQPGFEEMSSSFARPKPAITLSRKDWHSGANRAVVCLFQAQSAPRDPAPPAAWPRWGCGGSSSALKAMRSTIRDLGIRHQTQLSLADVARRINPLLRGWIEYYGRYAPSALYPLLRYINLTLRDWVMRKFKRFAASKSRAGCVLKRLARQNANLFVHWRIGMTGTFA